MHSNCMTIQSRLPNVGTTIFTVMSALAHEHQAINLSQGFPDFPSSSRLVDLVHYYMRSGQNQYAPMAGVPALREQLAKKIQHQYGVAVDPMSEITITAGATQALFTAITALVHPGDEVIMLEPAYDSYRPAIELSGGIPIIYEMQAPDYQVDWSAVQALITPRTRMLIINTPHNPTGTILRKADIETLDQLLAGTDIILLSDEVYEHLIFGEEPHESILRYPRLRERSLAVYSFGKTFHNTGWKIGYCVAPDFLSAEFRKVHQFNVFSVNTPVQYALAEFLQQPEEYLELPNFYERKRDYLNMAMHGSRLRPLPSWGTYFQLFDYSAISNESDLTFARRLTTEFGVAAIPVSAFYSSGRDARVIRLCFAKKEDTLAQAGALLQKV
ncbi:MAG TPA: methionine aminotransferase [Saprospiraceae bacterium]|nr:methionine aminotransferase [Saprospiraceae bacterium]HMP13148.1 methionine aminotransferase [Saprospiraceae bacterium]